MYCFSKRLIERNKNDKNIKNTYMEKVFLKIAFTKEGNSRGSDKSRAVGSRNEKVIGVNIFKHFFFLPLEPKGRFIETINRCIKKGWTLTPWP